MRVDAAVLVVDAVQHGAVGDAGGAEDGVAGGEFVQRIGLAEIGDAGAGGALLLVIIAEDEAAEHLSAYALQRGSGEHAFRGAALADIHVDAGGGVGRCDHAGDIAVGDQRDARAGRAQGVDDVLVARTVEHADGHVFDLALGGLGERLDVVGGRRVEADQAFREARADGDLVHIRVRRVEQAAARGDREHGERVGHGLGGQRRAFQRVERDVDLGALPGADFLADVEHRGFVPLAFADHDAALELDLVEGRTHRVHGGGIGLLFVTPAHFLRSRDRGEFRDPYHRIGEARRQNVVFHMFFSTDGNSGQLTLGRSN